MSRVLHASLHTTVYSTLCSGLTDERQRMGSKDIGMGVRQGTMVSFVPTSFGCFLGF